MQKISNVGLIGCGHIAETYFRAHKYFNNFRIITVSYTRLTLPTSELVYNSVIDVRGEQ